MVVEIVKTGQETQDALAHQGAHLVDDQRAIARIVEARGHAREEIERSLGKAGEQEPAMGGDGTARGVGFDAFGLAPCGVGQENVAGIHCVVMRNVSFSGIVSFTTTVYREFLMASISEYAQSGPAPCR